MSPAPGPSALSRAISGRLVTLLAAVVLLGACTGTTGSREPASAPRSSDTGDAEQRPDLTGLDVPRTSLCGAIPDEAVREALDGPVSGTSHYDSGEEFEVRPGYVDVAHEYGCVYEGEDGTTARVWVFARPVQRHEARTLVRRARRTRSCAFPGSLPFGSPGVTSVCERPASHGTPRQVRARLEGLFGDSWVGCEVAEPMRRPDAAPSPSTGRRDVLQRADGWCVTVVTTVGTRS